MIFLFELIWISFYIVQITETTTVSSCRNGLGIAYYSSPKDKLSDDKLSASSERPYCLAKYGRLYYPNTAHGRESGVWCPTDQDKSPWFQIDFGQMTTIRKVTIATNPDIYEYTKSFTISYRYKYGPWFTVNDRFGNIKVFPGVSDVYMPQTSDLGVYLTAQYIRIHPKTKYESYCLQLELHGCSPRKYCHHKVNGFHLSLVSLSGMIPLNAANVKSRENNNINKNNFTLPLLIGSEEQESWLQIDFKSIKEIYTIHIQSNMAMRRIHLKYSTDEVNWRDHKDTEEISTGNGIMIPFKPTIFTRFVIFKRIHRNESYVQLDIIECLPERYSIPILLKGLSDITIHRGESLSFECVIHGQPQMKFEWRKNGEFFTTDDRVTSFRRHSNGSTTFLLLFKRVSDVDQAVFSCIAWYPDIIGIHAKSDSVITVITPMPYLDIVNVSNTYVDLILSYIDPLTKDMRGFVLTIKHPVFPFYQKHVYVGMSVLNRSHSIPYRLSSLYPYSNYTVEVGILYVAGEIGHHISRRRFYTLQDSPYGAPLNLYVERLSPESLGITWSLPEYTLRNGPITRYQVRYIKSMDEDEVEIPETKLLNETYTAIHNLEAGAIYHVSVRAFTNIGAGPFTYPATLIFTGKATAELDKINKMVITKRNAAAVCYRLQNITSDREYLNKHDVELTIDILEKVVIVEHTTDIGESLISIVSNVLKANKTVLEESEMTNQTGTRYVKVLEKWLEGVDVKDLEEDSENVIVRKVVWHRDRIEEEIKFAEEEAEIIIPTKILEKINKTENVSVYFVFYKYNKFFREPKILETKCVDGFTVTKQRSYTSVISGDIVGTNTENLSEPIIFKFKMNTNATLEESACVYWDFKDNHGKGDWSTRGCRVNSIVGQTIECHCNHLTNFAAMMDIYAHTSKICGHHQQIISYITIIGCFLSLIGLFITFLTYSMFKRLHEGLSAKVLVQLCISLFVVDLTFITGIEQVEQPTLCTFVAITIHYFTLVAFFWMLAEATLMYYSFVKVWPPREGGDIYKSCIAAWGIPFVIVLITYLTNQNAYKGEHYCHVTGIPLYVAYLTPMGIIILTNFTFFISIMYRLSIRPNSNTDTSLIKRGFVRCRRAFGIMILMGLTWSLGFGLSSSARLQISYMFAITNGLQGFAIFMFYCMGQQNARKAWLRFFMCDSHNRHERENTESYSKLIRLSSSITTAPGTKRLSSKAF